MTAVRTAMWWGGELWWWYIPGFQVREQRLGHCVPANPELAHGLGDVVPGAPFLKETGGVVRASIHVRRNSGWLGKQQGVLSMGQESRVVLNLATQRQVQTAAGIVGPIHKPHPSWPRTAAHGYCE